MVSNIAKRVRDWDEMQPFYSDAHSGPGKSVESRNAESVLNAVILAFSDARTGTSSDLGRMAFDHAWALQSKDGPTAGAWVWQNFHLTPWESPESEYYWAAMIAVAVGKEPDLYRQDTGVKDHVAALNDYLRGHYDAQPLFDKLVALWASHWFPDLLTTSQRDALLGVLYTLQRPDGGWSLADLGTWKRIDGTPVDTRPDGCATGLVVLILEEAANAGSHADARAEEHIEKGIAWLKANQDKSTGAWPLVLEQEPRSKLARGSVHERRGDGLRGDGSRRLANAHRLQKCAIRLLSYLAGQLERIFSYQRTLERHTGERCEEANHRRPEFAHSQSQLDGRKAIRGHTHYGFHFGPMEVSWQ